MRPSPSITEGPQSCRCRARRPWFQPSVLFSNTEGQAVTEYALITVIFALVMIVAMVAVQHASGRKLNTTQNGLSGEYATNRV